MKKYLLSALALPLLFACSSEDYLDQKATDNDQFAGIEKVDATFSLADMDEGSSMRLATDWGAQLNDRLGFAWLTDDYTDKGSAIITIDGKAYQNHPLFLKQEGKGYKFVPETSIYVGKYFVYYPYDETTVDIGKINFKSLEEQTITDGIGGKSWAAVAEKSINIGDKFTEVTPTGKTDAAEKVWEKAGINQNYHLYAAPFSNQTGLDLNYKNNNPKFEKAQKIKGATDIDFNIAAGEKVGAAAIYSGTVELEGAAKSFTYAPTTEPSSAAHSATYWATQSDVASKGFDFSAGAGAITLKAPKDSVNGISTAKADNKGWFWFNSLPVTAGTGATTSTVDVVLTTSYGTVTVKKDYDANKKYTVGDCAYVFDVYSNVTGVFDPEAANNDWIKLATADNEAKKEWNLASHKTFINHYGDHKGKFALEVDFSKGVMDGMHIKNDEHLQKLLKYYIASGKTESPVKLYLDAASDEDKTFKLSKISIALLQTINNGSLKVSVQACAEHDNPKIIVTQDGQTGDLADKTEVPALGYVFGKPTDVYLAAKNSDGTAIAWTWSGVDGTKALSTGGNVKKIINEGTLTVKATNVEVGGTTTLENAAGATMDITQVTTVKDALTNLGTINVKENAELRAYNAEIKNDATALDAHGTINNYGVVGVSAGTTGQFNNYGLIVMKKGDAITLLTSNEKNANTAPYGPFKSAFAEGSNMMGTVKLPDNNPTALVSVANTAETGFIKYNWDGKTYATPEGNVKYNTIVVDDDITFGANAPEIQFIEFNGSKTQVVNPETPNYLTKLRGIIVNDGMSIIIEKTNIINCIDGVFLGTGATIYKGGKLQVNSANLTTAAQTNYLGTWKLEQIVKF